MLARLRYIKLPFFLLVFASALCVADEVIQENGITIRGKILNRNRKEITIQSGTRKVVIQMADVAFMTVDQPPEFKAASEALRKGDVKLAIAQYKKVQAGPEGLFRQDSYLRLMECYACLGMADSAIREYLAMLSAYPETAYIFNFPWQMEADSSLSSSSVPTQTDPKVEEVARLIRTWTLVASGRRADVSRDLAPFYKSSNSDVRELARLVSLCSLFKSEQYDPCLSLGRGLVRGGSDSFLAWLYYWQGRCYLAKGDATGAALSFLRVPTLYAQQFDALAGDCLFYVGEYFEKQGDRKKAVDAYREVIQEFPLSVLSAEARKRLAG